MSGSSGPVISLFALRSDHVGDAGFGEIGQKQVRKSGFPSQFLRLGNGIADLMNEAGKGLFIAIFKLCFQFNDGVKELVAEAFVDSVGFNAACDLSGLILCIHRFDLDDGCVWLEIKLTGRLDAVPKKSDPLLSRSLLTGSLAFESSGRSAFLEL
jgi:hypothetical protein